MGIQYVISFKWISIRLQQWRIVTTMTMVEMMIVTTVPISGNMRPCAGWGRIFPDMNGIHDANTTESGRYWADRIGERALGGF